MTPPKRRTTGPQHNHTEAGLERHRPLPRVSVESGVPWWSHLAWPVAIVGAIVFVTGWIGAAIVIPFDPHHVLSQFVGFGLVFAGIRLGSGRHT